MANDSSWRANVILTYREGYEFENLLAKYGCKNPSQFCKKIVNGLITVDGELAADNDFVTCKRDEWQKLLEIKSKYERIKQIVE